MSPDSSEFNRVSDNPSSHWFGEEHVVPDPGVLSGERHSANISWSLKNTEKQRGVRHTWKHTSPSRVTWVVISAFHLFHRLHYAFTASFSARCHIYCWGTRLMFAGNINVRFPLLSFKIIIPINSVSRYLLWSCSKNFSKSHFEVSDCNITNKLSLQLCN